MSNLKKNAPSGIRITTKRLDSAKAKNQYVKVTNVPGKSVGNLLETGMVRRLKKAIEDGEDFYYLPEMGLAGTPDSIRDAMAYMKYTPEQIEEQMNNNAINTYVYQHQDQYPEQATIIRRIERANEQKAANTKRGGQRLGDVGKVNWPLLTLFAKNPTKVSFVSSADHSKSCTEAMARGPAREKSRFGDILSRIKNRKPGHYIYANGNKTDPNARVAFQLVKDINNVHGVPVDNDRLPVVSNNPDDMRALIAAYKKAEPIEGYHKLTDPEVDAIFAQWTKDFNAQQINRNKKRKNKNLTLADSNVTATQFTKVTGREAPMNQPTAEDIDNQFDDEEYEGVEQPEGQEGYDETEATGGAAFYTTPREEGGIEYNEAGYGSADETGYNPVDTLSY